MTLTLADMTTVPAALTDTFEAAGWTPYTLAGVRPEDLTDYDGIGPVTAGKIIEEAKALTAEPDQAEGVSSVRCLAATRLVIPETVIIDKMPYALSRRYTFTPGQVQTVPARDATILLKMHTKPQGCCNSDEKPRRLFDAA